jgi:cytochrome oxidase assembly protein ShyY1
VAHLLALVCVGAAVGLGLWQYDAWQARRAAERVDLTHADPVEIADVLGPDDPFPADDVGRPVTVAGVWLPEATVLVSGREAADGDAGSWLVTPLAVDGPDRPAIPVVLGWLAGKDPSAAPAPPTGEAEVVGWIQPGEGTGEADEDPTDDVLPQLRIADLVQRVDQDMYGAYLIGREPAAGLEQATPDQLPPAGTFTAWRNFAYAIEWWLFAGFALFIWWRHVREATSPRPEQEAAAGAAEERPVGSGS